MSVAQTILQQLGGNRFIAMTGAKNFLGGKDKLIFSIPHAKNGINKVSITLTSDDLYTVEFYKFRKLDLTLITSHVGVYNDMLQEIFTNETGLYTRL